MDHLIYDELASKSLSTHYLNRYVRFIKTFGNTGGTTQHHILPKADDCWPQFRNFKEHSWNKCLLTPRQHFIAHWMLWKVLGGSQTFSFYTMKNKDKQQLTSRVYQSLMEDRKELYRTEDYKRGASERAKRQHREGKGGMLGKKQSDYQKRRVSEALKGVPKDKASVAKQRQSILATINDPNYVRPYKMTEEHKKKSIENLTRDQSGGNNGNAQAVTYKGITYSCKKECCEANNLSPYLLNKQLKNV